ncbi:hypothetical protein NQ176_g6045 [Zarea fungicola]|uniref:Uncharacterized protein n=1 Tax=Zarea fungicola TaxID=93591 RepID=A0ACC1N6C8_9HYPO|nr:hypothetical protein NQ176_g6045 [Lecanicillium fungicola]
MSLSTPATSIPSLIDATLDELIGGLEAGLFTSVDLVETYLSRIEEARSTTNPVTEINPDAVRIAASLDAERAQGKLRGQVLSPYQKEERRKANGTKTSTWNSHSN